MWNTLLVDVSLDDLMARPVLGAGGPTRDDAHAGVQHMLDAEPRLSRAADQWRMDVQRVRVGSLVWTIYEYDDDPWPARWPGSTRFWKGSAAPAYAFA